MHFLFVLDATSVFVSFVSHGNSVLVSEVVSRARSPDHRVKESLLPLLHFKSATRSDS